MTEQLDLGLPGQLYGESTASVDQGARTPAPEWMKERILDALRREELPREVCGSDLGPLQPEEYDLSYLHSAVHNFDEPIRGPHDRNTLWDTVDAINELVQERRVIEGQYYYGSKDPGSGDYRGFKAVYRLPGGGLAP